MSTLWGNWWQGKSYSYIMGQLQMGLSAAESRNGFDRPTRVDYEFLHEHQPTTKETGEPCAECGDPWPCQSVLAVQSAW